ncbi:TetR/AcrR family transcriptional regulator [Aureimonas sp. AU4]|uniref:TetR/AcrR family transcriptional regulator n=1 Tax=Aureimonas sp. AU4 TaxID=1638163 RepID=UPI000780F2A0|nr:TetR/AcrR family transcriptional regulator [Aureimonas sp. AU4]
MSSLPVTPEADAPHGTESKRQQILNAARVCFSRWGFHGASMGQICAEARMSPGALYRYFPSKDAIIEAIANDERVGAQACMAELEGEGPLADRIVRTCISYLEAACDPETGGLMVEICSESLRNTAVGQRFAEIEATVRRAIRTALEAGIEAGEVDRAIDLDKVVTILFGIGDGLLMRLQMDRHVRPAELQPYLLRIMNVLLKEPAR